MRLPEFLDSNYTGVLARAAALESEFANPTTGVAAGFGMLHERISSSPRLSAEVAGFAKVAAAPPTGAMKIPVKDLHQRVQRIQDALEDDHALREQLELPLSEVQAISGTDRWDTVNVSALIGFGNWVRGVNGIALACGVTAGVARFLIGAGAGSPVELATWEGVASGAAVYLFISSRQGARGRA